MKYVRILALLLSGQSVLMAQDYSNLLKDQITGDIAYETTAYVEKYWRLVGNAGFDSSIYYVENQLIKAGYVNEKEASPSDVLTYRIETRPLDKPSWEPIGGFLKFEGNSSFILDYATNRNMFAINSFSGKITTEVVYLESIQNADNLNLMGKVILTESHPYAVYKTALKSGAAGILSYSNPQYLQPEKNVTSIQFRNIPYNEKSKIWCIALSYDALEKLKSGLTAGKNRVSVEVNTKFYPSEELTIIAEAKGKISPHERIVFSSHVQEPGANDNASGVGANLEMAITTAKLVKAGKFSPNRTITFLWGDEIISTRRYVQEDKERAKNIKWGFSLDMVGENTAVTGGSFLIEKMPDPSAIWTRGNDKHTEWGASEMTLDDMQPHYINDFVHNRFKAIGEREGWTVNVNPFEGGSDHVPFLKGNIPGALFWHFTDQFYHTDNDRMDKVSKTTLKNVSTGALTIAYTLVNADTQTAEMIIKETTNAALDRLDEELKQGQLAINNGESNKHQIQIIDAWEDWYVKAIGSCLDLADKNSAIEMLIKKSQNQVQTKAESIKKQF